MAAPDQSAALAMVTAADLCCALCRKRSGEPVTKLCHACGLPVHLSCAQHVAARECALEFGFPLPAVYCSKRCYENDFLGDDGDLGAKRWSPQVPNEVTAALTLKIGDVSRTSRKHLAITTFRFLLSEGFEVFKAKVNSRTIKELQAHTVEPYVREDMAIYIRPGVHSKQAELVELSEKNFEARIRKTFRNFLKRKSTQSAAAAGAASIRSDQFECDIYTYVKKESAARRRAAATSGQSSGGRGGAVKMLTGLAAQHHLVQSQQQRQLQSGETVDVASEGEGLSVDGALTESSGANKRRASDIQDGSDDFPGYKSIRMVLNGSVVAVKMNVADLVSALGVPASVLGAAFAAQPDSDLSASAVSGDC